MDGVEARQLHDEGDVGVVVVVGAARHVHDGVDHADVLGVGLQVLRGGHDHEADGPFVPEHLLRPPPDAPDGLHGRHAVDRDQDRLDDKALVPHGLGHIERHVVEVPVKVGDRRRLLQEMSGASSSDKDNGESDGESDGERDGEKDGSRRAAVPPATAGRSSSAAGVSGGATSGH